MRMMWTTRLSHTLSKSFLSGGTSPLEVEVNGTAAVAISYFAQGGGIRERLTRTDVKVDYSFIMPAIFVCLKAQWFNVPNGSMEWKDALVGRPDSQTPPSRWESGES